MLSLAVISSGWGGLGLSESSGGPFPVGSPVSDEHSRRRTKTKTKAKTKAKTKTHMFSNSLVKLTTMTFIFSVHSFVI